MLAGLCASLALAARGAEPIQVDLASYVPDRGAVVRHDRDKGRLEVRWPAGDRAGRIVLDLHPGAPLIEAIGLGDGEPAILEQVDPVVFVTVGSRVAPPGRPPGMSNFNVFFDAPARRPHQTHRARLDLKHARVSSVGHATTIVLDDLTAGPFAGNLQLTVYHGAPLVHVEAVVRTDEPDRAFLYDSGLAAARPSWGSMAWIDLDGRPRREGLDPAAADRPIAAKHRAIVAESAGGSVACLPPPHQYFFPRDLTDNLKTTWAGRGHRGLDERFGFGVRQSEEGGGSFVPWFNAPPGTGQRLGVFYLLSRGPAAEALRETLRYTHGDRFPERPGYLTFTSHWHMATAVAAMGEIDRGGPRSTPDLVKVFKDMNVQVVHLAEFHGDGHPQDPGPLRLPEMAAMAAECRRLSDDRLLVLPGEEANVYFGEARPGQHPGHWLYLFPRPVTWTMRRAPDQPFVEQDPKFGKVYHVGDRADLVRLLEAEHGLAWTAHPRIKASSWAPDTYKDADYFKADSWLGAAWKAMPGDLSRDRLGTRALDLLDDMANWGARKQLVGEVDVFKIDRTHELYGHMNVNYLKLDRLPRFDDDWTPILDALRSGRFFTTTGEVMLAFDVKNQASDTTPGASRAGGPEVRVELEWTFPLRLVELISGDGHEVFRDRLVDGPTGPFGRLTLQRQPDLRGRTWVRVEAWDVAGNGAFSQPVWLVGDPGRTR